MTAALAVMVWFAVEKRRRQPKGGFEKFWYTHHLFIVFFLCWQLHGMFCMIQPDRGPLCSFNVIGVFWVSGCPLTRRALRRGPDLPSPPQRFWLPGG
jgi:hypothetical protein